ncbi:TetR/AcrR family transcriptional regulator [Streptomyces sp. NPDC058295]|uniref:TetR/AcrR family transcriptional regulator n=1 Tax=Streptomyces sp. NPDC058295 TaxID=3346431 RepID=UPI0036EB3409
MQSVRFRTLPGEPFRRGFKLGRPAFGDQITVVDHPHGRGESVHLLQAGQRGDVRDGQVYARTMVGVPKPKPIIWMRAEKSTRGPAPQHSREQIAEVAIEIADAEGIEAASVRNIAKRLGAAAMTLYRYLPTKEDLYAVMIDQATGFEQQEPTGDVRADLTTLARRRRQTFLRHPWLAPLLSTRPVMGPNFLRGMERDLALLAGCDLDMEESLAVLDLIHSWVSGIVQAELTERAVAQRSGIDRDAWRRHMQPYLMSMLATGEFPYLSKMIRASEIGEGDERFENGLTTILDGIEARFLANTENDGSRPVE